MWHKIYSDNLAAILKWKNRIACIEKYECLFLATAVIIVLLCTATLSKYCLLMPQQENTTEEGQDIDEPDVQLKVQQGSVQVEGPKEIGGREGLEPTRYGDWEKNGRCIDF